MTEFEPDWSATGLVDADPEGDGARILCGQEIGDIVIIAELWEDAPPLTADGWQDIAEVSVAWRSAFMDFGTTGDEDLAKRLELPGSGDYRLRVHGRNRDDGDPREDSDPVEEYLIQVWSAPQDQPITVTSTSETATVAERQWSGPPDDGRSASAFNSLRVGGDPLHPVPAPSPDPGHRSETPGGVRDGETRAVAAARELSEEIGHRVRPGEVGRGVAPCPGVWSPDEKVRYRSVDSYFFLRVVGVDVDFSGIEELERSLLDTFSWWTQPELRSATERVLPVGPADLLSRVLDGDVPVEPVALPWSE
ncbi:NUDIX domain-containing protein [Nonomuraea sp. 10N515B]|uniref:NUDIX domain-containing protein n=1 Tax=Nonomuraea sp. 10N515B TaxID=3457422 RepID=UPI003FCC6267